MTERGHNARQFAVTVIWKNKRERKKERERERDLTFVAKFDLLHLAAALSAAAPVGTMSAISSIQLYLGIQSIWNSIALSSFKRCEPS